MNDIFVHPESDVQALPVKRILFITFIAFINAILAGFIARALVLLIDFVTNLFFFGKFSLANISPAQNHLGLWVLVIPVVGGVIVGIIARYGSKGIRGHGIPEAMEKILTEESNIPPVITFLKPISAAFAIGTGGPFGAEGPIIATGGALGSFCGQTLHTTARERKILLAAGAAAGMTAIFGTPFAAILLAIELLLFEFSPQSFIPVVIACVTAAGMHFLLFSTAPVFPMPVVDLVSAKELPIYAAIGLLTGVISILVTKSIYWIEDAFEKLPVNWMWWPAIGGLAVGIIGYIAPETLGVGYQNITHALTGQLGLGVLGALFFWKFISWAIALGSGTSGGTLAPILTIGSAFGCLAGMVVQHFLPDYSISLPLCALVGMAALFAGASRALLTSIVFAVEATMQENTLLPLIAGCVSSYMVSFLFMRTTIMTEKINRRGIATPESFIPDVLQTIKVQDVIDHESDLERIPMIGNENTIAEVKAWIQANPESYEYNSMLVVDELTDQLTGIVARNALFDATAADTVKIKEIAVPRVHSVYADNNLHVAVHLMLKTEQDVLPVIERESKAIIGSVSYKNIFTAYDQQFRNENLRKQHFSAKRNVLKVVLKGKQLMVERS